MKVVSASALCAFIALMLQMETAMAQTCSRPTCRSGPIDTACQCSSVTYSTCPFGFNALVNSHGHCYCERKTQPLCKRGFWLKTATCKCTIRSEPTCPTGSSLTPSALCIGESEPYCPLDAVRHGCQCVKEYVRQCSSGARLSNNGCKCTSTQRPTCSNGCRLNPIRGCTCESDQIQCFNNGNCYGQGTTVSSTTSCCAGGIPNTVNSPAVVSPAIAISSHRTGNGLCIRCFGGGH